MAAAALEDLFETYGAPLVVKNDGGRELNGSELEAVLHRHGVAHLRSPEYYPRYNGAIEAGIVNTGVRIAPLRVLSWSRFRWTT